MSAQRNYRRAGSREAGQVEFRPRSSTPPKVYSYTRWSTPGQGDGDSLRRQTAKAEAWAKANGYQLAETRLQDAGVSAFRGDNVRSGALGAFLQAARSGEIPQGSILYVENLD